MLRFIIPVCVAFSGSPALADGFSISDLGITENLESCMMRAEDVLEKYLGEHGGHNMSVGTWSSYAWDLLPGDQDASLICVNGTDGDGRVRAILVVYGEDSDENRIATRDIITEYWEID